MSDIEFNQLAILAAKRARLSGVTQTQIAGALKVSQSQVSRVLAGASKKHTKLVDEVCMYVNKYMHETSPSLIPENSELNDAITSVWDGSVEHARAIAGVIRSLGAFTNVKQSALNRTDRIEDAHDNS